MPAPITTQIKNKALEILRAAPNGLRWTELQNAIKAAIPEANVNTIEGSTWNLDRTFPDKVSKPARGLFKYIEPGTAVPTPIPTVTPTRGRRDESTFYDGFKMYLKGELGDADDAIKLGGSAFGDKWSTPDVLGIRSPEREAIIKFNPEITSAELKVSTTAEDLITGFGQACAYLIFSHKSYLVIPKQTDVVIIDRLEALCMLFGIGLVLFDKDNVGNPNFVIRNRSVKHEPDMFFVNHYIKKLSEQQKRDLGI